MERVKLLERLGKTMELWEILNRAYVESVDKAAEGDSQVYRDISSELLDIMNPLLAEIERLVSRLTSNWAQAKNETMAERLTEFGLEFTPKATPVVKLRTVELMVEAVKQVHEERSRSTKREEGDEIH